MLFLLSATGSAFSGLLLSLLRMQPRQNGAAPVPFGVAFTKEGAQAASAYGSQGIGAAHFGSLARSHSDSTLMMALNPLLVCGWYLKAKSHVSQNPCKSLNLTTPSSLRSDGQALSAYQSTKYGARSQRVVILTAGEAD